MFTLTLWNWLAIAIIAVLGIVLAVSCLLEREYGKALAIFLITVIVCFAFIGGLSWYHNNTAKGARVMKDFKSSISNGLNREITITAEDGREIFHYEGRVDVETSHEGNANYILFETEDGLRYIICYGIPDTVLILEKAS